MLAKNGYEKGALCRARDIMAPRCCDTGMVWALKAGSRPIQHYSSITTIAWGKQCILIFSNRMGCREIGSRRWGKLPALMASVAQNPRAEGERSLILACRTSVVVLTTMRTKIIPHKLGIREKLSCCISLHIKTMETLDNERVPSPDRTVLRLTSLATSETSQVGL